MRISLLPLAALLLAANALGQAAPDAHAHHGSPIAPAAAGAGEFSDAEVRRVDKDGQKLTLRHGPIPNLGMGDMTMVFRVADPKVLDGLKPGDKVRFKADKVGGQIMVTELLQAK